jgi:hypothetical protein
MMFAPGYVTEGNSIIQEMVVASYPRSRVSANERYAPLAFSVSCATRPRQARLKKAGNERAEGHTPSANYFWNRAQWLSDHGEDPSSVPNAQQGREIVEKNITGPRQHFFYISE